MERPMLSQDQTPDGDSPMSSVFSGTSRSKRHTFQTLPLKRLLRKHGETRQDSA